MQSVSQQSFSQTSGQLLSDSDWPIAEPTVSQQADETRIIDRELLLQKTCFLWVCTIWFAIWKRWVFLLFRFFSNELSLIVVRMQLESITSFMRCNVLIPLFSITESLPCPVAHECDANSNCIRDPNYPYSPYCRCKAHYEKSDDGACIGKIKKDQVLQ